MKVIRDANRIYVTSEHGKAVFYEVYYSGVLSRWVCTCAHWQNRLMKKGGNCKHIEYYLKTVGGNQ